MKKTTKILSVFMALLMVVTCIPVTAFAAERDTSSVDAYLDTANLGIVVEDLLTALGDRKEEIVPTVLNICFQVIADLKDTAEANGVDVMTADTEALAGQLIVYLDKMLAEVNLNSEIAGFSSIIGMVLGGVKIELNSVDGMLTTLVGALDYLAGRGKVFCGDAASFSTAALKKGTGRNQKIITSETATNVEIINALFGFISDSKNIEVIKKVVSGDLDLGSVNGIVKMAGIDAEAEVANLFGNLDATINELLYNELIAGEGAPAYADSVYVDYTSDELLAAALLKLMSGEDAAKDEATALAGMTLYQIIGKYADKVIAQFALEPLNNDLKTALNDLIAVDAQLDVLKDIINMDYEFKADTFNFTQMAEDGLFENLNDLVCNIAEVVLQPAVYAELGLKKGGNENITANLTSVFAYILKTLASNNGGKLEFTIDETPYSFDFSGFTAEKIADKNLEDMLVAVVGLFYPTLLQVELPAEVTSLEQLAGYTAYVAIDKFMVNSDEVDFDKDYKDLVFTNGKVKDLSQNQWNNVLGEMGMDVAIYWLNDATNFGMTQADVDALKAKGWTWENFFEEIVDWALGYISGLPAVADELSIKRGEIDGYGAWYKLNVVLNELFPFGFINDCGDETFTLDIYTAVMEKIVPSLYDCDFAAFANVLATNEREDNPFNQPLIASVLGLVDNLLFSLFAHESGDTAEFEKAATATHDGYKGTYDKANGHYIDVEVIPATGEDEPVDPPTEPVDPPTEPVDPPTEPVDPPTEPVDPPVSAIKPGDVTEDGEITASDARKVLRVSAELDTLEGELFNAGDVSGDGEITASDARKILRVSAELDTFE